MATLAEIRQQHPEYNDLSDRELAERLHARFYSDMPYDQFAERVGAPRAMPRQMRSPEARQHDGNAGVQRQARAEIAASNPTPPPERPRRVGQVEDVASSFLTAIPRGLAATVTFPRDLNDLSANWAEDNEVFGDSEIGVGARRFLFGTPSTEENPGWIPWPSLQEVDEGIITPLVGPQHQPQTTAGEYARTAGEFVAAAAAPGSAATRASRVFVPAAASEAAGQATEGTPYEVPARLLGGIGGGIATEVSVAANAQRAARRLGSQANADLEAEFGPMTAGERSGNPRQRLEEDDLRRGMGSERSQAIMQGFDDRRAPEIQSNVLRIATRGMEPTTEDIGAAGTAVADALRSRIDDMRTSQRRLYDDAFSRAENEIVSANQVANELTDRVNRIVADEFLDAQPSVRVIERLQGQISQGQATYATVERARQALNRQLTTAMKAGDDASAYGITRIIDELDSFVAPRLSPEASRAITEARGFTREMLQQFGQRQRTDLATGHVGRSDPGGRAIERVLNQDMTGEQVIDQILGGNTRPSQQTLGAVRRIREINDALATSNPNAASGARLPGRRKRGGQTRGERAFAADNPNSRYGVELPNPELQALREALFHRILRPLGQRNQGGMIPAQTVVTNLRRALDGAGKEITALMFTERELQAMRRALAYMERLTPPTGAAVSGTTPAISRMLSQTFDKLVSIIPGIGPVMRELISDANSTGQARRAVRPPQGRTMNTRPTEQPTTIGPALVSGVTVGSAANQYDEEPRRRIGE